jgi:hypothetical protein
MLDKALQALQNQLVQNIQEVFYLYNKVATGKTVESVDIQRTVGETLYRFDVRIGGGYPYIVGGRRAGQKPPPNPELADWANAVGFTGPIPTLAFFIGKVGIDAVDLKTPIEESIKRAVRSSNFTDAYQEYLIQTLQNELNNIK